MVNRPEKPKVLLHESHFLWEVNLPQKDWDINMYTSSIPLLIKHC